MWYSEVSRNINKIPDAIAYFESELIDAKKEVKLSGNVERASVLCPVLLNTGPNQLQEIEAYPNYLNIQLRRLRSSILKNILKITPTSTIPEMLIGMLTAKQTLLTMKKL